MTRKVWTPEWMNPAVRSAVARYIREGHPLATVEWTTEDGDEWECHLPGYDALVMAKDIARAGGNVELVTERGNRLDADAIIDARF